MASCGAGKEYHMWFLLDVIIAVIFMNFDYRGLQAHGKALYIINLVMLLAVMLFGHAALGAQRWIQIGPISLQPSEFAKLIMIICMASVRKFKHIERFTADCGLCGSAVYFGFETAGLGNVFGFYGNFFRNGNSLRNPLENLIWNYGRGNCLHAATLAIFKRLSKNANNGFSRPER